MEVPRLSPSAASHPEMLVVASTPRPQKRPPSGIPQIDVWTERAWEEHYREEAGKPVPTPAWLVAALGTLITAAVLKAGLASDLAVWTCVIIGTALSCFLLAKRQTLAHVSPGFSSGLSLLLSIGLLILAIPVLALGVLFVGCTVCR